MNTLLSRQPAPAGQIARARLPNGLLVVAEERRLADTVALQLAARAGSRDDAALPGITVITSRMLFQGTRRRPSETALQRAAAQVGGTLGRGTGAEQSSYGANVPSVEADVGFDLLADLISDPLLAEDALARQKQIAQQELAQRRADPGTLLGDVFQEAFLAGHPAASPAIGTPESVAAITREAVVAQRERAFGAANLVLAVVGRLPVDQALARAERFFAGVPAGAIVERPPARQRQLAGVETVRATAGQQQAQFRLGMAAPPRLHADYYPMAVLTALMAGDAGRIFEEVRNQRGLAYVAGAGYNALTDAGAWFGSAGVDPRNLEAALDVVRAEIRRLRDALPPAGEVAGKIGQIAGQQIVADEGNAARAGRLAAQEVLGTESTEEFVQRIRAVTPEDVLRVARAYLDPDRALLAIVGPPG
jgi:zinc protease